MIANLIIFDYETNSPGQYQRKYIAESMRNMDSDVRVWRNKRNVQRAVKRG